MNRKNTQRTQELYKLQTRLSILSRQKAHMASQLQATQRALEELPHITEEKVYKIINNVLIQKDVQQVIKELKTKQENISSQLISVETEFSEGLEKLKEMGIEFLNEEESAAGRSDLSPNMNSGEYILRNFNPFNDK